MTLASELAAIDDPSLGHEAARAVTWAVNDAENRARVAAIDQAAQESGQRLGSLWVAERDACVHCLALSGFVAYDGDNFDGTVTFGDRPLTVYQGVLPHPPRHPHCRCRVIPWSPEWDGDLPATLHREATRSIVNGYARPSEPEAQRRRAAQRLLDADVDLPKTVKARARSRLRSGNEFARAVP